MRSAFILLAICYSALLPADVTEELLARAQEAYNGQNYAEAARLYQEALKTKPDAPEIMFFLGKSLIQIGSIDEGLQFMEKSVALVPSHRKHYELAELAQCHKRMDIAVAHYEASLDLCYDEALCEKLIEIFQKRNDENLINRYRSRKVLMEMVSVRGLPFKEKIEVQTKSKEEMEEVLIKVFENDLPPEKAEQIEDTLLAFGLIPPDVHLREIYISFMSSQIVGFYDPDTKQMYLLRQEKKEEDIWDHLLGISPAKEGQMIMAHELTHSLQDQHFDLNSIEEKVKENDDRYLAFGALVEGDATLAMLDYQFRPRHLSPKDAFALRLTFSAQDFFMSLSGDVDYNAVPLIIRETVFFPYIEGFFFCLALREHDPWKAIDQAYTRLPPSTEHILHPEKYMAWQDMPWDFPLKDFSEILGENWKEVENNVLGEAMCAMLFKEYGESEAKTIAAGWGGDRYSVLKNASGDLALIWLTVWDSRRDAGEFFQGYQKILNRKYPSAAVRKEGNRAVWQKEGRVSAAGIYDKQVRIVENVPAERIKELWEKLSTLSPFSAE